MKVKALKSGRKGHIKIRIIGRSYGWQSDDISATIAVDLDLETARAFHADIGAAIEKETAKVEAHQKREARRKAWREREIAAGRMRVITL